MFSHPLTPTAELRPPEPRYAPEIYATAMANLGRLKPWFAWAHDAMVLSDTEKFLDLTQQEIARGETFLALLFVSGKFAGSIDLHGISKLNRRAEIGYWLAADFEGQGLMTRAARAVLNHGFGPLALHRIDILADPTNTRSRAIPERLGFTLEAVRKDFAWVHNRPCDLTCYTLTAPHWHSLNPPNH